MQTNQLTDHIMTVSELREYKALQARIFTKDKFVILNPFNKDHRRLNELTDKYIKLINSDKIKLKNKPVMKLTAIPENWKDSDNVIERLVFAVNTQMGDLLDRANDISNHGISGGYSGFIYYNETCAFYRENKDDIWELATDQAEELGSKNVFEMLSGFGGAKDVGGSEQFENLMAWYAAEEAARYVIDYEPEEEDEEEEIDETEEN